MADPEEKLLTRMKQHPGAILLTLGEEPLQKEESPRAARPHQVLTKTINMTRNTRRSVNSRRKKKRSTEQLDGVSGVERRDT